MSFTMSVLSQVPTTRNNAVKTITCQAQRRQTLLGSAAVGAGLLLPQVARAADVNAVPPLPTVPKIKIREDLSISRVRPAYGGNRHSTVFRNWKGTNLIRCDFQVYIPSMKACKVCANNGVAVRFLLRPAMLSSDSIFRGCILPT